MRRKKASLKNSGGKIGGDDEALTGAEGRACGRGLLFAATVYPMVLFVTQEPALAMMMSLYVTLGIFLILAARNPSANRSLIAFAAWSSLVHAAIMAVQAFQHASERGHLLGDIPALVIVGVALIALAEAVAGTTCPELRVDWCGGSYVSRLCCRFGTRSNAAQLDGKPMVAAFGLVCEVKNSNSLGWILQRGEALPATGVGGLWGLLEPKITVVPRVLSLLLCPTPHKGSDRRRPFLGL